MPAHPLTTADPARWYQAGISLTARDHPERILATTLGPGLHQLSQSGAAAGWWFMRKPPGFRIRLLDADPVACAGLLDDMAATGAIARWQAGVYEPETAAFGGPAGMDIAHVLFAADSRAIANYLGRDQPIARRELSLLLIAAMLESAGLDRFERGDVLAKVAALRPDPPADSTAKLRPLGGQARTLLSVPATALASSGIHDAAGPGWTSAFTEAGGQLAAASACGLLSRGLRAILAHAVIFHWNRLGLTAATQGILATAARDAFLPPD